MMFLEKRSALLASFITLVPRSLHSVSSLKFSKLLIAEVIQPSVLQSSIILFSRKQICSQNGHFSRNGNYHF